MDIDFIKEACNLFFPAKTDNYVLLMVDSEKITENIAFLCFKRFNIP